MDVQLTNGVEIELATGDRFVADATAPDGDVNFLSHAHGDHLFGSSPGTVLCSELTARLAEVRRDELSFEVRSTAPGVELLPAGHVPGSRAALIDDGDCRICYTGDVSPRDRFSLRGFDPVDADVLVVESTYGKPTYEFPAQSVLESRIVSWFEETRGTPLLCFGYSLGRAQEIQRLVARADRGELYVTGAIAAINDVLEDTWGVSFGATLYESHHELDEDDVLVLPARTSRLPFVNDLVAETGAVKAGFSGWAITDRYRHRAGVNRAFPLSDHADYGELLGIASAVDPEVVYTHHGFADELATAIRSELGIPARSLKRNQSTLDDF